MALFNFFFKKKSDIPVVPAPQEFASLPAWIRLEDQLKWYDGKSVSCQKRYKTLKTLQVILAVSIPALSLLPSDIAKVATSLSGVAIALLEAVQQMNQYLTLWVSYRGTAEHLKHEKFLFLSEAGPYRNISKDERVIELAERIEGLISTEHANWNKETLKTNRKLQKGKSNGAV